MPVTDPLSDMLTRIRNANIAKHGKVDIPASKMKISVAKILKDEGYIKNYKLIKDRKHGIVRIYLKYDEHNESAKGDEGRGYGKAKILIKGEVGGVRIEIKEIAEGDKDQGEKNEMDAGEHGGLLMICGTAHRA